MTTDDALLFIDANKYLDPYRTVTGKDLLASISEQTEHIFVTQQVVDHDDLNLAGGDVLQKPLERLRGERRSNWLP